MLAKGGLSTDTVSTDTDAKIAVLHKVLCGAGDGLESVSLIWTTWTCSRTWRHLGKKVMVAANPNLPKQPVTW